MAAIDLGGIFRGRTGRAVPAGPALEDAIAAAVEEAQRAWPRFLVADEVFVAHLADRVGESSDVCAALAGLHRSDLYFACAMLHQDAAALAAFDELLLRQVPRFLGRMAPTAAQLDDIIQDMRIKLLVPNEPGRPPKIAQYGGRHSLESWLCTVAIRAAIQQRRGREHAQLTEVEVLATSTDPEFQLLRMRHEKTCGAALREASKELDARDRRLMRLYYRERYTFEELGWLFHVNQTTARRWLVDARTQLIHCTRLLLQEQLRLQSTELNHLLAMLQSRLDVSLGCIWGADA